MSDPCTTWQYAKGWKKCARCQCMLPPTRQLATDESGAPVCADTWWCAKAEREQLELALKRLPE